MNNLQVFESEEFGHLRTIEEDGKVLFVGRDAAKMLGYSRPADAITAHCKGSVKRRLPTKGGMQEMKVIPEGDLYRLIAHSELPSAERFESWVFDEVLPTIRKTGGYQKPTQVNNVSYMIPKTFSQALQLAANLQAQIEEDAPLVAYASAVMAGDDCITVGTLAKIIEQKYHVHIGQNRLYAKLREDGILMKAPRGHKDHNRPTQRAMDAGWFVLKGNSGTSPSGDSWENFTPYVTPKGRIALVDKYGRRAVEKQMALNFKEVTK